MAAAFRYARILAPEHSPTYYSFTTYLRVLLAALNLYLQSRNSYLLRFLYRKPNHNSTLELQPTQLYLRLTALLSAGF